MGRHRAQPAYERVIQENRGRATALAVIPPLLLTAAPATPPEIKPTSSIQVLEKTGSGQPLDQPPQSLYGDDTRSPQPIQAFIQSDTSIIRKARHVQAVKEKADADAVAEASRLEQERIAAEEAEKQRIAQEQAAKEAEEKAQAAARVEVATISDESEEQADKVPDEEDPSDFDVTDETQSSDVFAVAEKYLGIPYRWGGNNPATGLDCSAFTKIVYKQLGVDLPRISRDQAKVGIRVSADEARPGDLVFFGSPVHHVGIYAGNGRILDARKTGTLIGYGNVWNDHTQYRRVL